MGSFPKASGQHRPHHYFMTKKKAKTEQWNGQKFSIGRYQLGFRMVEVFILPEGFGGSFSLCPKKGDSLMEIGMAYDYRSESYGVLLHEAMEAALTDAECSFKPNAFEQDASDIRRFFFDHNQFTEAIARTNWFLCQLREDFDAAWKKVAKWSNEKERAAKAKEKAEKAKAKK